MDNRKIIEEIIKDLSFKFPYSIDEWNENMYIENYHSHTYFSNVSTPDSPVSVEDYAKRIKELGTKCIFSGEHGNQGNQFEVYTIAENEKLKYVHSTEAYWVKDRKEKDSTNCHICIIALNDEGRKDINFALSMANIDGYYYKPRIDLDLLLNIPKDNVVITTACLAGWKYEDADEIWLKIANHFKENFFFEVQNHNTEKQKELNKHIIDLAEKNNIQIICGLDSHYINYNIDDIKREQILKYKKITYEDEQGWYLDYPDGKEIFKRFKQQGILTDKQILTAMINTNVFVDKCQEIKFDRKFKIPSCYPNTTYEERVEIFKNILNEEYKKDKLKSKEKVEGIRYEAEQIIDSGVVDYFLTNRKILKEAVENQGGILTTTSRGSMASFIVNKLLGFTTIDRFNSEIPIYPERFLTKERVLAGQMPDCDFNIADQEPFLKASRVVIGKESCYPLMAVEKLKTKASWQLYAGANGVEPQIANEISKCIDNYNDKIKHAEEEDKEFILIEDFIPNEYIDLYKESLDYQGIVINLKIHACFEENTLVLTENGYKKIKDIKVGDFVLTHDGTYQQVLQVMINQTNKFYNINITGDTIKTTYNHPFYVKTNIGKSKRKFTTPYWKEAKDLKKNDFIGYPINNKNIIPIMEQTSKTTKNKLLDLSDNNVWWLIGRYIGDGWTEHPREHYHKIVICCNKNNNKELEEIVSHIPSSIKYKIEESRTTYKINFYNKSIYDYLQQFGKYAYGKHLTNDVFDLPKNLLKSFLEGYLSADGHISDKEITFSTVSKELAYGLQQCIHKVYHMPCTLNIIIPPKEEYIEGRKVFSKKKYKGRFKLYKKKTDVNFYEDNMIWFKLKNLTTEYTDSNVYNLSVNHSNSYTANGMAVHNCGFLLFEGDIRREIGLISAVSETTGKRTLCACIEGGYLDAFGFVKNDFLIVDSVALIKECFDSINQPVPTFEELKELIKDDKLTWSIYENGITCCINQCEKESTTNKVKKYKPKTLAEISSFIAAIRPGFASLLNTFLERKPYTTGEPKIDTLLSNTAHFAIYQESLMKLLSFLHLPMTETYGVIKSISKKKLKGEKKNKLLKDLETSWQEEFHNKDNFNKIWKVIEDSAHYAFNAPHAYSMGGDSVYLAYFKSHYPSKFYEVAINHYQEKDNKLKIDDLLKEANKFYGYTIGDYKYGDDNRKVNVNDENKIIYPNMSSIKNMQKVVPNILYEISKKNHKDILTIFKDIFNTEINKKSLDILIKINYFSQFGDVNYILNQMEVYKEIKDITDKLKTCKQLKKDLCEKYYLPIEEVKECCENETEKMFKNIDNEKLLNIFKTHYQEIKTNIVNKYEYIPTRNIDIASDQIKFLGYTNIIDTNQEDNIYIVKELETNKYGTVFVGLYHILDGISLQHIKVDKQWFKEYPCEVGDILKCSFKEKDKKRKDEDNKWYSTGEKEFVLNVYSKE